MRSTHTYVELEVTPHVFDEIRTKLEAAGYQHAFMGTEERPAIDMHGIGLVAVEGNPPCSRCGGPHPFDTTVPSVVWNSVIRARQLADYLCLTCIVAAFAKEGRSFTAELIGGAFTMPITIEVQVNGDVAQDAALISDENTTLRARIRELEEATEAR